MHHNYYGLNEPPFSISPNPDYFYLSKKHNEAFSYLTYGLNSGGFVMLTGEVGTGKTVISRYLLDYLNNSFNIALILNSTLSAKELLCSICDEFSIELDKNSSLKDIIKSIYDFLLDSHAKDMKSIVIIDEAQHLSFEALEQLRLLTNLETKTTKLIHVLIIGQPELQELISRKDLRQLSQRITSRYHLQSLPLNEVSRYVNHRLKVAGRKESLFTNRAFSVLANHSQGVPRVINLISERSLIIAYSQDSSSVEARHVEMAVNDVFGISSKSFKLSLFPLLLLLSVSGFTVYYLFNYLNKDVALDLNSEYKPFVFTPNADVEKNNSQSAIKGNNIEQDAQSPRFKYDEAIDSSKPPLKVTSDQLVSVVSKPEQSIGIIDSINMSLDKTVSLKNLYNYWGLVEEDNFSLCDSAVLQNHNCNSFTGDMDTLLKYNYPAVTKMVYNNQIFFVALLSVESDKLQVKLSNKIYRVTKKWFKSHYAGSFDLIHHSNDVKQKITKNGSSGDIYWLSSNLSFLLKLKGLHYKTKIYDNRVTEMVKSFQSKYGLNPDGIAGPKTLLVLSILMDTTGPRLKK